MKNLSVYLFASCICMAFAFVSCGNDNPVGEPVSVSEIMKYPYSSLTPEQQKEKLANEANAFLTQIQDLNQEKGIEVVKAFNNLLNMDAPVIGGNSLKSADDIIKINYFYGKFTWQPSSKTWKEEKANQLEFNFPVGSSTGRIVITGVSSGKNYTYEEYYEYYDYETGQWIEETETIVFELPKQLLAKLYLGGSEVGKIQVDADIVDAQSAPKSITVSYSLGSYNYTLKYVTETHKVTATLKKGNTVLINVAAVLDSNLNNLDESDIYISLGNFTFQLMDNLAFSGSVDFANYNKEMDKLYDRCYPYPYPYNFDRDKAAEDYAKGTADIINKYYDIYLVSIKDKTKIAKLIEKAVLRTSYYYSYWEVVAVLKFNDSTEVEAEVFFSEGFDTVLNNFAKFIQSFQ